MRVEIRFEGLPPIPAVEADARRRLARLARGSPISACRLRITIGDRPWRLGRRVDVELVLAAEDDIVRIARAGRFAGPDALCAIVGDAFRDAHRRLAQLARPTYENAGARP